MTARQMLEALLIELNKVNAPSLLLEDYNYFINKAIYQYINKSYNFNEINQQYSDNTRVLKATAILTPEETDDYSGLSSVYGATYEITLPQDYLHMLNCICIYDVKSKFKCYNSNTKMQFAAKRLTSDSWSTIINDYYNRPTYKRPYYYIHNVNTTNDGSLPTNPYSENNKYGTDLNGNYTSPSIEVNYKEHIINNLSSDATNKYVCYKLDSETGEYVELTPSLSNLDDIDYTYTYFASKNAGLKATAIDVNSIESNFPRTLKIGTNDEASLVEKDSAIRVGNPTGIRCEIRYGSDSSVFELKKVLVDYIKVPQTVRITQEQMDLTLDTSQIMEFPDYVCQEIINELVHIVMENGSDQRLQTHIPVSQSIASPAQQQAAK